MDGYLASLITLGALLLEVGGVLSALHAVLHSRTAQGSTAWAISLVTFPFVSLPLYWVFGHSKFKAYVDARRTDDAEIAHFIETLKTHFSSFCFVGEQERSYVDVLERLGRLPFSSYNHSRLLIDGEATFRAIFDGIERAEKYILVQFFIIKDDELGGELQRRLIEKAKSGVRVYLLYDQIGCHALPAAHLRRYRDAGVTVAGFKPARGPWNRYQLNFRNHRKIVVIDGKSAFVGGHNVGDEYVGKSRRFGHWRDTHVEMEGPVVDCIQIAFMEDWYWATKSTPEVEFKAEKSGSGNQQVMALPTGPADQIETCALFFLHSINLARTRVWIASPYFVPDNQIMSALQLAALRGVDVRILLPGKPDHLLVYLSSFDFIKQVDSIGVKFYRYQDGFLHQKVILVDDQISAIGTANLDNRSFRLNFELMMVFLDQDFSREVSLMLEEDFSKARRVDESEYDRRPFWFKLAVRIAKLLSPIQ